MLVNIAYWQRSHINWESFDEVAFLDSKKKKPNQKNQLPPTQPTSQWGWKELF